MRGHDEVVIVMHDNPDPDAIAAGWAVQRLLEAKMGTSARLLGGGDIVRAENREMVRLLQPPMELVNRFEGGQNTAAVLVDCGVGAENHLLKKAQVRSLAMIDHHQTSVDGKKLAFEDLRPGVAASATITASYLREQKVPLDPPLATALLYAIRTETRHAESYYSKLDRHIIAWLTETYDPHLLVAIENAPLSQGYYSDLVLALQNTFVYGDTALCFLPRAEGAEIIGEVSDLLVRGENLRRVLCAGVVGDDVLISVRTQRGTGNAAELVQQVLAGAGSSGGHTHRAGGKIAGAASRSQSPDKLFELLRAAWLSACKVDRRRGTRLIAKREIVENL